ncbi:hypothetical protein M8C21_029618 [Ambrosia artemisiifolia]|uniref:Non-specific serine/threonine protein kinase n=1 Tax=Ambrosia artemisiifolia TaxID=4212 RepID=A0AAD5GPX2_AMBAR|nr:hypothetical protein M8C21_029618 [Ambrosia artemisiifolia]
MKQNQLAFIQRFLFFVFFFFFFPNGVSGSIITVVNECGFTIWPAISGSPDLNITGFKLTEGNSRSFETPENWSGRLWGRTDCSFNGSSGHGSCKIADCGSGEMECNGRSPIPPVTIAEFDIKKSSYFVNLRDGYNLPITIEPAGGSVYSSLDCTRGCASDLNKRCPKELMLDGGGGCQSPCQVFGTPMYCCSKSLMTCEPTAYSRFFHAACPRSDDVTSPDLYTVCVSANYTIRFCPPEDAFSTLKVGSKLGPYDQLVSISGKFTLGFFNGLRNYLAIWYTGDVEARKVWVANPNTPVMPMSCALSIDPNTGNLIITNGGKTLVKITDVQAGRNPNVTATLEDDGNFRLINDMDKRVLWQSFDHPTNVLLPGMKLGYDTRTRQNWTLTSWLSNGSKAFTLSWEPINETSQRLMIRRRGQPYWTSGFLDVKTSAFMYLQNGDMQSKYNLTSVYNNEERYFSYVTDDMADAFPMWILTPKGQLSNSNTSNEWTPDLCYGHNSSNGCLNPSLPLCRREDDSFSHRKGEFTPQGTRNSTESNSGISISDCFVKCWNDCSCVGFNSSNTNGTGCVIWTGIRNNIFVDGGDNSTMKYVINFDLPDNSGTSDHDLGNKMRKNLKQIWALVVVPLFLGLGLLWYIKKRKQNRQEYKRRKRDEYFLELAASESFKDVHQLESDGRYGDLLLFSFASIMTATNDFSPENKLGQGGFGPVYKGTLNDGREIAIKRLSKSSGQGLVEFKNELMLIAKLQHTNLVRILGCCIHGEEKMLVYEYMPNKSLDFFLFDENKRAELNWPKRFSIIEGIAQGLLYLHKHSRMRVIHRDIKSNNILLDESMNPKISDFGMARIFNQNETQAMTNRVVGT